MTPPSDDRAAAGAMREGRIGDTVFETAGAGPAVVLLHGLGLNRHMWDPQWEALTGRFQVLRYDLMGHGDSAKPQGPYRLEQFVAQLAALMDGLELERCALVGFSFGGMIIRAFALAHPARVSALAILNSAHNRTDAERAGVLERVEQATRCGPQATVDAALARWFTADFAARRPDVLDQVRRSDTGRSLAEHIAELGFDPAPLRARVPQIDKRKLARLLADRLAPSA